MAVVSLVIVEAIVISKSYKISNEYQTILRVVWKYVESMAKLADQTVSEPRAVVVVG